MRRPTPRILPFASFALAGSLALALGVNSVAGAASTTSGAGSGRSFPGTSGSVAALTASSMELQSQLTGQVTVSWTSSTTLLSTALRCGVPTTRIP